MNGYRKTAAAAQRFADRRQRENEAARLLHEVPNLTSLRLTIEEHATDGGGATAPRHVRHIVVETAPALFFIACGDSRCTDGGCDITDIVMRALRAGRTTFDGEQFCRGVVGSTGCTRVVRFQGTATYRGA